MKDHTGRTALEQGELYLFAQEFDKLRAEISVPGSPSSLPNLVTTSQHLATLGGLSKDLSNEVLHRVTDDDPGLDLGPVIYAYTTAAVPRGAPSRTTPKRSNSSASSTGTPTPPTPQTCATPGRPHSSSFRSGWCTSATT